MAVSLQDEHAAPQPGGTKDRASSWIRIASYVAIAVPAYLILRDHAAHVLGAVPYLVLLACPLMHLLMHGSHGHHHAQEAKE